MASQSSSVQNISTALFTRNPFAATPHFWKLRCQFLIQRNDYLRKHGLQDCLRADNSHDEKLGIFELLKASNQVCILQQGIHTAARVRKWRTSTYTVPRSLSVAQVVKWQKSARKVCRFDKYDECDDVEARKDLENKTSFRSGRTLSESYPKTGYIRSRPTKSPNSEPPLPQFCVL